MERAPIPRPVPPAPITDGSDLATAVRVGPAPGRASASAVKPLKREVFPAPAPGVRPRSRRGPLMVGHSHLVAVRQRVGDSQRRPARSRKLLGCASSARWPPRSRKSAQGSTWTCPACWAGGEDEGEAGVGAADVADQSGKLSAGSMDMAQCLQVWMTGRRPPVASSGAVSAMPVPRVHSRSLRPAALDLPALATISPQARSQRNAPAGRARRCRRKAAAGSAPPLPVTGGHRVEPMRLHCH